MIRAANTVIANIEGITLSDSDSDKQERLIGETYFLRAIMFNYLMPIHGRIPLISTVDPFQFPGLNTKLEVFEQKENDLIVAESRLPNSTNQCSSKPNNGLARAFLARLYMDWGGFTLKDNSKYTMAALWTKSVMYNAGSMVLILSRIWLIYGVNPGVLRIKVSLALFTVNKAETYLTVN